MKRRQLVLTWPVLLPVAGPVWAAGDAAGESVLTGGQTVREGRVRLEVSPLVENGDAVPVRLQCPGARRLVLLAPGNPIPRVAEFDIGPRALPDVSTRIRLASSQTLVGLAELHDGSWWRRSVQVIVTLAACIEGESS